MAFIPEAVEAGGAAEGGSSWLGDAADQGGGTADQRMAESRSRPATGNPAPKPRKPRLKPTGLGPQDSQLRQQVRAAAARGQASRSDVDDYMNGRTMSEGAYRAKRVASGAGRAAAAPARATKVYIQSGQLPAGLGTVRSSDLPADSAGQTIIRLLFALAAGVIALEIGSTITGHYFDWNFSTGWQNLKGAGSYVGLYPGQPTATPTSAPAQPAASMTAAGTGGAHPMYPGVPNA
jgi:hypothetical protein